MKKKSVQMFRQAVIDSEATYTNKELLEKVIDQAGGDDHDGYFTVLGQWEFDYLHDKLYERLHDWLER